jgi:hypothetical protein
MSEVNTSDYNIQHIPTHHVQTKLINTAHQVQKETTADLLDKTIEHIKHPNLGNLLDNYV